MQRDPGELGWLQELHEEGELDEDFKEISEQLQSLKDSELEMQEWDWELYRAFQHLSRGRPQGFGASPIRIADTTAYWASTPWGKAMQATEFIEAIQEVDQVWLEQAQEKTGKPATSE